MRVVTERLELRSLDPDERTAIAARRREGRRWADDYPTDGDVFLASLPDEASGIGDATPEEPWTTLQVIERESGLAIGGAGFKGAPVNGAVEIGYGLAASRRGLGYASEAVRALVEVARDHGARIVWAETEEGNLASERVLERCGFIREGSSGPITRWSRPA